MKNRIATYLPVVSLLALMPALPAGTVNRQALQKQDIVLLERVEDTARDFMDIVVHGSIDDACKDFQVTPKGGIWCDPTWDPSYWARRQTWFEHKGPLPPPSPPDFPTNDE